MTEAEWLSERYALTLLAHADSYCYDRGRVRNTSFWRTVASRIACLDRLGQVLPEGVRNWVNEATAAIDTWNQLADLDRLECLLYLPAVYAAFRDAYQHADQNLRAVIMAAQDAYHGGDGTYYGYEDLILAEDADEVWENPVYYAEHETNCHIIRDVFGNPFRLVSFDPEWRTSTAIALAKQMYESRDFSPMPILADALQDAGCDNSDILNHCRDTSATHVRGCWVVAHVLGKA